MWRSPRFEWLLAWRIVRSRKSQFLSVTTWIAILGVSFGVMMLTIVLGVTGGFQDAFRERILGLHPHLLVWPRDDDFGEYRETMAQVEADPRVLGATPATYDEVMIAHGDRRAGAVMKGMHMPTVRNVLAIDELLVEGSLEPLEEEPTVTWAGDSVVLGNLLQETSWTVVLWGDDQVLLALEDHGQPYPDQAWITVLHAAPELGVIDVAVKDTSAKALQAVGGRAAANGLSPGERSRPIALPAGGAGLAIGERELLADGIRLESGSAYLLVLRPGGGVELLPLAEQRPNVGETRVRVVDARPPGAPARTVRIGETVMAAGTTTTAPGRTPAVALGDALAERLGASIGDRIAVSSSQRGLAGGRGIAPMGMEPTSGRFEVAGIIRSGYYDYDKRFAVVGFGAAQRFLSWGDRAKWLELRVDDVYAIENRKQAVQDILQPYSVATFVEDVTRTRQRIESVLDGEISQFDVEGEPQTALGSLRNATQVLTLLRTSMPHSFSRESSFAVITFEEVNKPLFQALKLQKLVLSIFFLIIIFVAALNIVGTQIMMVHQKTREIAILKALGADRRGVRKVFLIQGFIVAALGTVIGLVPGLGGCLILDRIGWSLEPEVYLISELPVKLQYLEISLVCFAALLLTFLATLYSANRAARLTPVEGIRYIE